MEKDNTIEVAPTLAAGIFTADQKMLALSWKEPYGSLMLHGKIETRTWKTNYRGWVLICASKVPYNLQQILNISGTNIERRIYIELDYHLDGHITDNLGKAIAIGKLIDCKPMTKEDEDKCFVEYHPGLWCHIYDHVQAITPRIWVGQQGWKELTWIQKASLTILPACR